VRKKSSDWSVFFSLSLSLSSPSSSSLSLRKSHDFFKD